MSGVPLITEDTAAVQCVIRVVSSLSLVRTNTKLLCLQYSLLSTVICRIFLFLLSPVTSWANDGFCTFTAIKSCSLIYFSLNLQSPVQLKAPLFPYPIVRPLALEALGVRRDCGIRPRVPLSPCPSGIYLDRD